MDWVLSTKTLSLPVLGELPERLSRDCERFPCGDWVLLGVRGSKAVPSGLETSRANFEGFQSEAWGFLVTGRSLGSFLVA